MYPTVQRLGLLDDDVPSDEYTPVEFSDRRITSLLKGCSLSEEIILKDM